MLGIAISAALAAIGGQELDAPARERAALEAVVREGMAEHGIPGLALAVRRGGAWVLVEGYGLARLAPPAPVTRDTRFQIASLTKPFTAAVVLRLAARGRLSLDDRAGEHLAWLPASCAGVTLRQLLNHTAGVPRDLRTDNLDDFDADEFRARLEAAEPAFEAGTSFQYANTGYILLGLVVEAVEGRPFGEVLEREVLEPTGLAATRYLSPPSDDLRHALGYEIRDGAHREAPHYSGGFTGGGLSASVADLARWLDALDEGRLLDEAERDFMHAPGRLASGEEVRFAFGGEDASYGAGWFLARRDGRRLWTHGGAVSGFTSTLDRYPDEGLCVIVLSNVKGPGAGAVAQGVAELLLE